MTLISSILVLTNLGFTAAFDTDTRCPAWVAYDLEPSEIVVTNRAAVSFSADPRVAESDVAADYARSGYDRGHLAPAADFNFDTDALRETYRFTNVAPQVPSLNRGRWAEIEAEIRRLASSGTVHVVTAPIYRADRTNRIGRVRIPDAFVKVAYGWFGFRRWEISNSKER